jgi:hypothetical protein
MAEVAHGVHRTGLSLKRGNEIVCALVERYEGKLADPDIGRPYDEVYDVVAATPQRWWLEMYEDARRDLRREFDLEI